MFKFVWIVRLVALVIFPFPLPPAHAACPFELLHTGKTSESYEALYRNAKTNSLRKLQSKDPQFTDVEAVVSPNGVTRIRVKKNKRWRYLSKTQLTPKQQTIYLSVGVPYRECGLSKLMYLAALKDRPELGNRVYLDESNLTAFKAALVEADREKAKALARMAEQKRSMESDLEARFQDLQQTWSSQYSDADISERTLFAIKFGTPAGRLREAVHKRIQSVTVALSPENGGYVEVLYSNLEVETPSVHWIGLTKNKR